MLALGVLLLVVTVVLIGAIGWFMGFTSGRLESYGLILTPTFTLAGSVFAFYFAQQGRKR